MGEEEKKAIKELRDSYELKHRQWAYNCLDTIEEGLETKNKIIDLMSEQLSGLTIFDIDKDEPLILGDTEEVKEYFRKKVENEEKEEK